MTSGTAFSTLNWIAGRDPAPLSFNPHELDALQQGNPEQWNKVLRDMEDAVDRNYVRNWILDKFSHLRQDGIFVASSQTA
jgi:hypothetical protein